MAKQIEKSCETCRFWIPMGECGIGGGMPCDKWQLSLSYKPKNQLTLWE